MAEFNLSNLKFLVVDDYTPMRRILWNVLRELGVYHVGEAEDGSAAMRMMKGEKGQPVFVPDILITDHIMTPVDGLKLTRMIRLDADSPNPFLPVIMVTARTDIRHVVEARDAGVTEFLAKPVSARLVYCRVRTVIESPRPFVRAPSFFGPDRRRRQLRFDGLDRRTRPHTYATVGEQRQDGRLEAACA